MRLTGLKTEAVSLRHAIVAESGLEEDVAKVHGSNESGQCDPVAQLEEQLTFNQ
jgi:hypothetical protein